MEALCSILAGLKAQTGVVSAKTWLTNRVLASNFRIETNGEQRACHGCCMDRIHAIDSSKERIASTEAL
jgi:hypothetical protein